MSDMPEPQHEVIAAGINVVDILARPPAGVLPGGKYPTDELEIQGGGPASTAACVMAAFGFRCAFVARLGMDAISQLSRMQFRSAGISEDFVIESPDERAGISVVQIDRESGERTICYSLKNYGWLRDEDIPRAAIAKARLVLVDGYDPAATLAMLEAAKSCGCPSIVDLEHGDTAFLHTCIGLATEVILPLHTARAATGKEEPEEVLRSLQSLGDGRMIVTDGARGSWAMTEQGVIHHPAFQVEVLDTNGCGDAYHGGYGVGLLCGWPLELRMEFAAWVASRVAMKLGGRAGIPDRKMAWECRHLFSPRLQAAVSTWE
jgi:sugar/nucleoside kinase (ribokinase family)